MIEKGIDKYANETTSNVYTNSIEVAIELSGRRKHEHSTSRTLIRLSAWAYKKAGQSRQRVVKIQSDLG